MKDPIEVEDGDIVEIVLRGVAVTNYQNRRYLRTPGGSILWVYEIDTVSVTKFEPPVVVFQPGQVVRHKGNGLNYALGLGGYLTMHNGNYLLYSTGTPAATFTSADYALVEFK